MIIVGYKAEGVQLEALKRLSGETGALFLSISRAEELNALDEKSTKFFFCFDTPKREIKPLLLKAGSNTALVWVSTEGRNEYIPEQTTLHQAGIKPEQSFSVELPGLADESEMSSIFGEIIARSNRHAWSKQTLIRRLNLIQDITHQALHAKYEPEIRKYIMLKLSGFYKAESCCCLEYDENGGLFLTSQLTSDGLYRTQLWEAIANAGDYAECIDCGEPIINCKQAESDGSAFICAPIMVEGTPKGLLRVQYRDQNIDIALDRTVLRIAADILSASAIRTATTEKLIKSEQRATNILDTTADAIITTNAHGVIESFNKAAERIFEYIESEVAGKPIKLLIPEAGEGGLSTLFETQYTKSSGSYAGCSLEAIGLRKSGQSFPLIIAVSRYTQNQIQSYTGIVRDITEQRRLELEVMRISEHERHRIGQDLHDGLGQLLSGIGFLSSSIKKRMQREQHPLAAEMHEVTTLLQEADEYARGLARGLVKIDLERGGFHAAIEKLVLQSQKLFRIRCSLTASKEIEIRDRTRAEHVYRIVQEAINNAVKHGYSSEISVNMTHTEDDLRITVQDNGCGFPTNWQQNRGLGVRIMEYRARLINAHFEHHNTIKGGAEICLLIPSP